MTEIEQLEKRPSLPAKHTLGLAVYYACLRIDGKMQSVRDWAKLPSCAEKETTQAHAGEKKLQ